MFLVNFALKYVSQRVFRENKLNRFGTEDPYYDEIEVEQRSYLTGQTKLKKVRKPKPVPLGISSNDEDVLRRVMRRAYHLDMLFNVFGYRVGWSGVVGVVPVVGDVLSVVFSILLFWEARKVDGGLPWKVQLQFLSNIAIDFIVGLVPVVGDFIEVMYKANSRNALILENHLKVKGEQNLELRSLETLTGEQQPLTSSNQAPLKHKPDPQRSAELRNRLNVDRNQAAPVSDVLKPRTLSS